MKPLWVCIALFAVLQRSNGLVEFHGPTHYTSGVHYVESSPVIAVTPAPKFYYSTSAPYIEQSPIHVTIQNDIVYADKEQHKLEEVRRNPHLPVSYTRTNSNSQIISSTFHGKPSLSNVSLDHPNFQTLFINFTRHKNVQNFFQVAKNPNF